MLRGTCFGLHLKLHVVKLVTQKPFLLVNEKKEMLGWLNTSLKSTETMDELSITLYLQSEINFCSVRMPVNA